MDPSCDPKVRHGGRCHPTMFKKQVSRPVDGLNPQRGHAEQVERTTKKDLVTRPIGGFCALQPRKPAAKPDSRWSTAALLTSSHRARRRMRTAPRKVMLAWSSLCSAIRRWMSWATCRAQTCFGSHRRSLLDRRRGAPVGWSAGRPCGCRFVTEATSSPVRAEVASKGEDAQMGRKCPQPLKPYPRQGPERTRSRFRAR